MRRSTGHFTKPEGENAILRRRFRRPVPHLSKNRVHGNLEGMAGIGLCLDYNEWNAYHIFSCGKRHLWSGRDGISHERSLSANLEIGGGKPSGDIPMKRREEHYRTLFANMMNGFAYCRMLFDGQGNPCDFIYLDVNAAFTSQTGLTNVVGKRVTEVIPGIRESDQNLLDIYGRVALTGISERFEIYVSALRMWFSIAVYSPEREYFVAIFDVITARKQAEDALREEEYYLEKSQALTRVGHWSMDLATKKITISDEMLRILQLDRGEANLDVLTGMTHPDDLDSSMEYVRLALEEGKGYEIEHRLLLRDGTVKWVRAIGDPKVNEAGKTESLHVTTQDITAQKHAEDVLHESEDRYRNLVELSPEAIYIHVGGVFVFSNSAGLDLLGASTPQALLGTRVLDRVHPDFRDLVTQRVSSILERHESPKMIEEKLIRLDGSVVDVEVAATPFSYHGLPAVQVIARDVTERKQAEEALREREQEFRKLSQEFQGLLDAIPDNITLQDRDLRIVWANRNAGMGEEGGLEELVGQHCFSTWHGRTEPCESCPAAESFSTGKPARHVIRARDGRMWDLRAVPLADEHGNVANVIEVARDITEIRLLEDQLLQSQKMESVGRLAGGVAHDFNNMLGVILGHTEMALAQVDDTQPLHDDLKEIEQAAQRSADLTRQLLAFARKQTVSPKVLDLNSAIEGLLSMLRRLIGEEIMLTWKPADNLWPVKMDSSQLDQILANLCVNARDAIAGTGRISIETGNASFNESFCASHAGFLPGEYVVMTVCDDGGGMSQETLSHLFEPFFTTKDLGRGTGLGLATVYGVIQQNKGFIQVDSKVGQGTCFKIHLPRHLDKAAQEWSEDTSGAILRGQETVLLVEDEPALLKLGGAVLKKMGYQVLMAATPGEALRLAEEHGGEIQLLMTDVIMPEMNGRDLAKRLQLLYPGIKRLFMSGYTADIIAHQGVLEEGVHFMQKPFSMAALSAKIREVLERG